MSGVLISETTREERERLVAESLGNIDAACDGCAAGVVEMYQDYIDGKKELREVNMEYRARYVSGMQGPGRTGCPKGNIDLFSVQNQRPCFFSAGALFYG